MRVSSVDFGLAPAQRRKEMDRDGLAASHRVAVPRLLQQPLRDGQGRSSTHPGGGAPPTLAAPWEGRPRTTRAVVANVAAAVSESHLFLARQLGEVRAYGQLSVDMVDRVLAELRGTSAAIDELRQHIVGQLAPTTEAFIALALRSAELDAHVVMYGQPLPAPRTAPRSSNSCWTSRVRPR